MQASDASTPLYTSLVPAHGRLVLENIPIGSYGITYRPPEGYRVVAFHAFVEPLVRKPRWYARWWAAITKFFSLLRITVFG